LEDSPFYIKQARIVTPSTMRNGGVTDVDELELLAALESAPEGDAEPALVEVASVEVALAEVAFAVGFAHPARDNADHCSSGS
jgi:hypothetical protein